MTQEEVLKCESEINFYASRKQLNKQLIESGNESLNAAIPNSKIRTAKVSKSLSCLECQARWELRGISNGSSWFGVIEHELNQGGPTLKPEVLG